MPKFKRLPNNYGNINKLTGKRRNPYHARICVDKIVDVKNKRTKRIYETVGYYPTYRDALAALNEYHVNPYDLSGKTFKEVYEAWSKEHFETVTLNTSRMYKSFFKICKKIQNRPFQEIRYQELQDLIDNSGKNYYTVEKIKMFLSMLYKYAIKNEIVSKNYASYIDLTKHKGNNPNAIERKVFTKEEIQAIWNDDSDVAHITLMFIYSGLRMSELFNLKKENVDLENQCIEIVKSKTEAGKRIVPIADIVKPFYEYYMSLKGENLITKNGLRAITYDTYLKNMWKYPNHTPYDTRHTFITKLTEELVDDRIIKKIVGHKGNGVTENVYTHIDIQTMLNVVNSLTFV